MTHCAAPEGCRRPARAKGLCIVHYKRMKRTGTTERKRPLTVWVPMAVYDAVVAAPAEKAAEVLVRELGRAMA